MITHVGDYWRWKGALWQVGAVTYSEVDPDDGEVQLIHPLGQDPRWKTVSLRDLRDDGELVWTDYPEQDKTLESLREHREQLHALRDLAHAVHVIRRSDVYQSVLSEVIGDQADALQRAVGHLVGIISRERFRERDVARRRLNDELGVPNCDHLVPEEGCPECAKLS